MSIDTLGRQAGRRLMDATGDLDVDDAFRGTLTQTRRHRRIGMTVVIATTVIVLVLGWSLGGDLRRSSVPAPPANAPSPVLVGQNLGAPMTAVAPEGWEVLRNRGYVEMRPADGWPGVHIYILVPRMVYEPPSYELSPLKVDSAIWLKSHPALTTSSTFGVQAPGDSWTATEVGLTLSPKAENGWVHLLPLSKAPGSPPLSVTENDAMFRWIVIDLDNADPLAIAATSPSPDDARVVEAVDELLSSIQIQQD